MRLECVGVCYNRVTMSDTRRGAFGRRLRQLREAAGLTQPELAQRAFVSHSYISLLETGRRRNPSMDVARKLAEALEYPLDDLLREAGITADLDEGDEKTELVERLVAAAERLPRHVLEGEIERLEIQAEHYRRQAVRSRQGAPKR